jgi:hypothetical protein
MTPAERRRPTQRGTAGLEATSTARRLARRRDRLPLLRQTLLVVSRVAVFLSGPERVPAELERVTLHECHHGFLSFLDAAGISEERADRYMDHSRTGVASRYRHQLRGQLAADARRLQEYLTGEVFLCARLPDSSPP